MKHFSRRYYPIISLVIVILLSSCSPSVPNDYISPSRLEKILYDLHLAESHIINDGEDLNSIDVRRRDYREAVFRKYGIDQEEFDKSMTYYYRHADKLEKIYEHLEKRFSDDLKKIGADDADISVSYTANGDTTNIWNKARSKVLLPFGQNSHYDFKIVADTTFYEGDTFILNLRTQYIIQDGNRSGLALMSVKLDNDSTITHYQRISADTDYAIFIKLPESRKAQQITGFIQLGNKSAAENKSTMKLLYVNRLSLLRIHNKKPENQTSL